MSLFLLISFASFPLSILSALPPFNATVFLGVAPLSAPPGSNFSVYFRHCAYVATACTYDANNKDFEYTLLPALNGAPGAVSLRSGNFPQQFLTLSHYQTPAGRLGIEVPADLDTASWDPVPGPSGALYLKTLSKTAPWVGAVATMVATNSGPCGWAAPDGDVVLAPPQGSSAQAFTVTAARPPPGPAPSPPPPPPPPPPPHPDFYSRLIALGLEYAHTVQPARPQRAFDDLADALSGGDSGPTARRSSGPTARRSSGVPVSVTGLVRVPPDWAARQPPLPPAALSIHVHPSHGCDAGGDGSQAHPFRSIEKGLEATRNWRGGRTAAAAASATILLHPGTHFLRTPIHLTPRDSGLAFVRATAEGDAWVSGGVQLNLTWAPVRVSTAATASGENVWVASTPASLTNLTGLRLNNTRLNRARFPNCNVERQGWVACGLVDPGSLTWADPNWCKNGRCANPPVRFEPPYPSRANESRSGTLYTLGIGGDGCSQYSPPAGFNCVDNQRWGGMVPRWPAGFVAPTTALPHTPYNRSRLLTPTNPAMVHGWQGWFSRHFEVAEYDPVAGNFTFGRGGFQGAEGMDDGFPIALENVWEELDEPGEWWWDAEARLLYLWHNATAGVPPPSDGSLVAVQLQVLFNATGTQADPVANVSFLGLGFRDTAATLLEPHGMPSSGDWALQRSAAIFLEGCVNATIDSCSFERLDGLGVFLSGFHRGAVVQHSEFSFLGETCVALWGYTRGSPVPGMGPDTTGGDQPRGSYIGYNIFRELGIFQKQSAAVFQAEAGQSLIEHNWIFNGPRAGINVRFLSPMRAPCEIAAAPIPFTPTSHTTQAVQFNDDSMGGSLIQYNVMANLCRESGE